MKIRKNKYPNLERTGVSEQQSGLRHMDAVSGNLVILEYVIPGQDIPKQLDN